MINSVPTSYIEIRSQTVPIPGLQLFYCRSSDNTEQHFKRTIIRPSSIHRFLERISRSNSCHFGLNGSMPSSNSLLDSQLQPWMISLILTERVVIQSHHCSKAGNAGTCPLDPRPTLVVLRQCNRQFIKTIQR